jgi:hypothetical protein
MPTIIEMPNLLRFLRSGSRTMCEVRLDISDVRKTELFPDFLCHREQ